MASPKPSHEDDARSERLGSAPLGPLMIKLSIPGMFGMIVMSIHNIVNTLWVTGLPDGTEAIAALTVMFPVQMVVSSVGMGIAMGLTSLVSRRLGEGRRDAVLRGAGNAIVLGAGFGVLFMILSLSAAHPLVRAFGATPELIELSAEYLARVSLAFPLFMVGLSLDGLYRGGGNVTVPMYLTGLSAVTNATLAPLLIYGVGPFPRWELNGAGVATAVAQVLTATTSLWYLRSGRSGFHLRRSDLKLDVEVIRDIAVVGVPAMAMNALRSITALVFNWVLGGFGAAAIAGHGLALRVMMLAVSCLGGGVHQALMPIVGYTFGSRDYRRMWSAYRLAAIWTSAGGLIIGGIICVFARQILAPLAREAELLDLATLALQLKLCTLFLVEPQMMAMFALEGMGFGGRAMMLNMSRDVILVLPALLVLPRIFGILGAYGAQAVADVLSMFVTFWIMSRVYRQYPPSASVPRGRAPLGPPVEQSVGAE